MQNINQKQIYKALVVHLIGAKTIYSLKNFKTSKQFCNLTSNVLILYVDSSLKLRCDTGFQRAFTACGCVFKVIMLVGSDQSNYF